jgi:hypothetical protein
MNEIAYVPTPSGKIPVRIRPEGGWLFRLMSKLVGR